MAKRHTYALYDKQGRLTAYALVCGYVERVGKYVEISKDASGSFYRVYRSASHRLGDKLEVRHLLVEARALAEKWAKTKGV